MEADDPREAEERLIAEAAAEAAADVVPADVLDADEVRRRATSGAAALGVRNIVLLAAGLVANLILARLLVPKDFGYVALGQTVALVGSFLASGGIGIALIGRPEPPTERELQSVLGIQLTAATVFAVVFAAGAIPFGEGGEIIALILVSLPLSTLRVPQAIAMERELSFRTIATVDVIELLAQYVWAVGTVALGAGVWGLASSIVMRGLAGSIAMILLSPLGLVRPRLHWSEVRPLMGFGVRFQAAGGVGLLRDQALNAGIALIGGIGTLGIWALAFRFMQVPLLLFATLYRVSYPAMAKLRAAGRDPRPALERGAGVTAVAIGVIVVSIAAGAPALVPSILGHQWDDVPEILGLGGIALMMSCPVAAATVGWLYAAGDATTVLRAFSAHAVAWVAVTLALLEPVGPAAIGIGWIVGASFDSVLLARAASRGAGANLAGAVAVPFLVTLVAGGAGWAISSTSETIAAGVAGVLVGELGLLAGLFVAANGQLREALGLARQGLFEARHA